MLFLFIKSDNFDKIFTMRTNGILMALSSLPSKFGIGDFGKTSYEFVDIIKRCGIKFWQMLPLNPLGSGNSPYSSVCTFAIDPIYIDLEELLEEGLIIGLKSCNERKKQVEYDKVRNYKNKILREAFLNQNDTKKEAFKKFIKENPWVINYAKFLILSKKNDYKNWWLWDKKERYDAYNHEVDYSKYEDEILFTEWCQFIAFKQFKKLKKYASSNDIILMGDMPYYVGRDSSDAWSNQDEFLLDENDIPSKIGGVPPDYFCADGQRWGNPCYDWEFMKEDGFSFWKERIKYMSNLFDYIRLDHFRAFSTYYAINPECPTARDGEWKKAYGKEFFNEILPEYNSLQIFAEDLGEKAEDVEKLILELNLPGMNVVQFTIMNSDFVTRKNQIIYTGTHDNQTLKGWINDLKEGQKEELKILLRQKKIKGRTLFDKMINYVLESECDYACIPLVDYLKYDDSSRMNTPGTCGSPNWEFRITNYSDLLSNAERIKELLKRSKR